MRSTPTGTRSPLLVSLLALLASCAAGSDPAELVAAGEKRLATQQRAAAASFDAALEAIGDDATHPLYLRARMGSIEARSAFDPAGAADDLVALSSSRPDAITDRDFNRLAKAMGAAGDVDAAIRVLAEGKRLHPESGHLDELGAQLLQQAQGSDDLDALEDLKSLGYL